MSERERLPIVALAVITGTTIVWWALALWPLPADSPSWLARARYVCFGSVSNGLPDATGWTVLILQPISMVVATFVIWGGGVSRGLAQLWNASAGRLAVVGTAALLAFGVMGAASRVKNAVAISDSSRFEALDDAVPRTYPRANRPAPAIDLVDQSGVVMSSEDLSGHMTLVTFAFAHCTTVCPLVVRDALRAEAALEGEGVSATVVVITLDPWRDQPSRLSAVAEQWALGPGDRVLSGKIDEVHRVLREWGVAWERDERTGDIIHPRLTYIVDAAKTIAYASSGGSRQIVELARRAAEVVGGG